VLTNDCALVQSIEPPEYTALGCFLYRYFPPERLLDGPGTHWGKDIYQRSCKRKKKVTKSHGIHAHIWQRGDVYLLAVHNDKQRNGIYGELPLSEFLQWLR
jgi:hypothetical protein